MGHSTGYRALIADEPHDQLPTGWDDAFSNHLFEVTNNHGRIFGPFQQGRSYVFIGAFSREQVSLLHWPEHRYASFTKARDEYAASLNRQTDFKVTGLLDMHNSIVDDPNVTTGDHDGKALFCALRREADELHAKTILSPAHRLLSPIPNQAAIARHHAPVPSGKGARVKLLRRSNR